LIYCDDKGGKKLGSIHLKISNIILMQVYFKFLVFFKNLYFTKYKKDDPLRIIINTGTSEINLKAYSIQDKVQWVTALRAS